MVELGTDYTLVRRAQSGDAEALELLLSRQRGRLRKAMLLRGLAEEETDVVIAAVETKIREHLREYRGRAAFTHWVDSIALVMTTHYIRLRDVPELALPA